MNKQELKAKLTNQVNFKGNYNDYPIDSRRRLKAVGIFEGTCVALELIDQLDEPELPVIPQFVADYIEETQRNKRNIRDAFHEIVTRGLDNENAEEWIEDSPDAFARAWLDGYTIEKESVKTRQVLVKFFDNEEYKTELSEDAARELIEFLEANKNE